MKNYLSKMVLTLGLMGFLIPATKARAEDIPVQFNSIFAFIEPYLLSGGGIPGLTPTPVNPGAINLSGCQPVIAFTFPTVNFQFTSSSACPVSGYIRINMIPLSVNVRLEFLQGPIEKLEADVLAFIRRANRVSYLNWQILNGYLAIRPSQYLPADAFYLTGAGQRTQSKTLLAIKSRVNIFSAETLFGTAFLKDVQKPKGSAEVKKLTACTLTEATKDNVQSGNLSNCREIN